MKMRYALCVASRHKGQDSRCENLQCMARHKFSHLKPCDVDHPASFHALNLETWIAPRVFCSSRHEFSHFKPCDTDHSASFHTLNIMTGATEFRYLTPRCENSQCEVQREFSTPCISCVRCKNVQHEMRHKINTLNQV